MLFGSSATKSPWINPFNISKEVKIADFRVEFEIAYATFLAMGPSKIGLAGGIEVGELIADAAMVVSHDPGEQLIAASINEVDLIQIIHVAGQIADIQALKKIDCGKDTFVFTDASMYISTGASIAGKEYPRGISAGGKLTAFGKNAKFDLSIGQAGLDFQGYIDEFKLGPLVVKSTSGDPRAGMVVLMTKDKQVIKVDGMVTCFNIGLATLIDIQLGTDTPSFDAYLALKLTEAFQVSLYATVDDFSHVKDLATKGLYFRARIEGDLFEMILKSIEDALKDIEKLGTDTIDAVKGFVGAKVAEKEGELKELAQQVKDAKAQVEASRKERQGKMQIEKEERQTAENEINRLRSNVDKSIRRRDDRKRELEGKVKEAEIRKENQIAKKRKEYDEKLKKAKKDEKENRDKLARLKREQETKYGIDFLKEVKLAQGAWYEKKAAEDAAWRAVEWAWAEKCKANWYVFSSLCIALR